MGVDPPPCGSAGSWRGGAAARHRARKSAFWSFCKEDKFAEAKEAGAEFVGGEELIAQIQGGWLGFDSAIATPDMMGLVGRIARILGPSRDSCRTPRSGTVTTDLTKTIGEIKAGKVEYRVDRTSHRELPAVGKASFTPRAA